MTKSNLKNILFLLGLIINVSCSDDDTTPPVNPQGQDYPEIVNGTFDYQSEQRVYSLHIPDSFDGTESAPLVVFLHGGGGNSQSAQNFTNFNEVSEDNGFLMLYPQAGFEFPAGSFIWADGRGLAPDVQGIDDVGYVNNLIDFLETQYNINEDKIYLCGFSNGSFLTQKIAFEANSQFAAIGTIGGTMSEDLFENNSPNRAIPMIYIFGADDPFVPYDGGFVSGKMDFDPVVGIEEAVDFWINNNNCQTTLPKVNLPDLNASDNSSVRVFEYINGDSNSRVKYYEITGGGHTWPGVLLPNQNLGNVNMDIEASKELWEFFNQFAR